MTLTDIVLVSVLVLLVVFNVVIASTGHAPTISQRMWAYAKLWPVIPFALGFLCGHWFWKG